jgi:hypothetical protein
MLRRLETHAMRRSAILQPDDASIGGHPMPKLYRTDVMSEADLKIYVTDVRLDADLVVHETSDPWAATESGIWYYTDIRSDAEKIVFFTDIRGEADLIVHKTDSQWDTGWQNSEKAGKL